MTFRSDDENLFEDTRMSFGEHLEELRKVLIRALAGIAVGCVIGFLVAERVVQFLQRPLEKSLTKFYVNEGKNKLRTDNGFLSPTIDHWMDVNRRVPERVFVDPIQLQQVLDGMEGGAPPAAPERGAFLSAQFDPLLWPSICRQWATLDTNDSMQKMRLQLLWDLLAPDDRQAVEQFGTQHELSHSDCRRLADLFNQLADHAEIHGSSQFRRLLDSNSAWIGSWSKDNIQRSYLELAEKVQQGFDPVLSTELNKFLLARTFGDSIGLTERPLVPLTIWKSAGYQSQSLGATEPFMIWMKAGLVTGAVLASPWVFYQLWTFVAAGLYPTEKRYVHLFLPVSLALFLSGASLAFLFVFEPVLDFLFGFNARMGIAPQPRINDWLSFVLFLPLGFGIAFQLPLVMLFVNRIDLISVEAYWEKWRIAIVAIFGIAMVLTPADPVSMILLACPLTALYFLGILLCRWFNQPSNPYARHSI